jgi:hypothetical protein
MLSRMVAVGSIVWAAAIPVAALAAARPHGGVLWYGMALAMYGAGSAVCHQLPWRSFYLSGAPLPVCARCTGVYAAAACVALMSLAGGTARRTESGGARRAGRRPVRTLLLVGVVPTALTLAFEWTSGVDPGNGIRAAAGASLGAALAWIVIN